MSGGIRGVDRDDELFAVKACPPILYSLGVNRVDLVEKIYRVTILVTLFLSKQQERHGSATVLGIPKSQHLKQSRILGR